MVERDLEECGEMTCVTSRDCCVWSKVVGNWDGVAKFIGIRACISA